MADLNILDGKKVLDNIDKFTLFQLKNNPEILLNAVQWTGENFDYLEDNLFGIKKGDEKSIILQGTEPPEPFQINLGDFIISLRSIWNLKFVGKVEFLEKVELATGIKEIIITDDTIPSIVGTFLSGLCFPGVYGHDYSSEFYDYFPNPDNDNSYNRLPHIEIDSVDIDGNGSYLYKQWESNYIPGDGTVKLIVDCDNKTLKLKKENPKD